MDDETRFSEYEVGFGKPPAVTRFKKGRSGNPKGRPKGTLNMATVLARTLREKVVINENGQRKIITKLEAAVKQLVNKAASGDLRALRHLADLVASAEERAAQAPAADTPMSEDDQKVVHVKGGVKPDQRGGAKIDHCDGGKG
jgi:hypothetical protein